MKKPALKFPKPAEFFVELLRGTISIADLKNTLDCDTWAVPGIELKHRGSPTYSVQSEADFRSWLGRKRPALLEQYDAATVIFRYDIANEGTLYTAQGTDLDMLANQYELVRIEDPIMRETDQELRTRLFQVLRGYDR